MRCLNPACGSVRAHEINVSFNVSECHPVGEVDYVGHTDFAAGGNTSGTLGTVCEVCGHETWVSPQKFAYTLHEYIENQMREFARVQVIPILEGETA
jgi:hypothetical protein